MAVVMVAAATLTVAGVQAHENLLNPTHKHGLEIKEVLCNHHGRVLVMWKEGGRQCHYTGCQYACLYRVWGTWEGKPYEDRPHYHKCHIANSWDPLRAEARFNVTRPDWTEGEWGVVVRDGATTVRAFCGH